ncbi:MAG: winged helix DNA-binding protein [Dehalococcoidales bacterium]|nr:winged helix DNA-binding protein [Dehalococcoidales bacterium]
MEEILKLDEYNMLWQRFSQARSAIVKARQKKAGKYLHPNWGSALVLIWSLEGQATPGILSEALFLEHHSVSELINRLEKKGLVKRTKDPDYKNRVRLSITEKGRRDCYEAMQTEFLSSIMSSLSKEQAVQFKTCLDILLQKALDELGIENKYPQ